MADPYNNTLSNTCANLYSSSNGTYSPQNPLIRRPNDTTIDTLLYNFVTVTKGPRANISSFENCFNTWECSEVFYNNDCYMDMQDSSVSTQTDYDEIIQCLDEYGLPYRVYVNKDPLTSGAGRSGGGNARWKAVLASLVVAVGLVGIVR